MTRETLPQTHQCPVWCDASEHYATEAGEVLHLQRLSIVDGIVVDVAGVESGDVGIFVEDTRLDTTLTTIQARALADGLTRAADLVDGRAAAALVVEDGGDRISFHLPAWLTPAQRDELRRCTSVLWSALVASHRMGADA